MSEHVHTEGVAGHPRIDPYVRDTTPELPPIIVDLHGVEVRYDGLPVLEDIDLCVHRGEFVALLGPNGGGKTTLLRTMLGFQQPSKGSVRLFDAKPGTRAAYRRIGYLAQTAVHIDPRFPATVKEVVMMGRLGHRSWFHMISPEDRRVVKRWIYDLGLERFADHRVGTLSPGWRQRTLLARALVQDPELLLLDEPTSGVDPAGRREFYALLDRLNHRYGVTVIIVSHDDRAMRAAAHRLVIVDRTKVFDGLPSELEEQGGIERLFGMRPLEHEVA